MRETPSIFLRGFSTDFLNLLSARVTDDKAVDTEWDSF
jgi:hypothetical protein